MGKVSDIYNTSFLDLNTDKPFFGGNNNNPTKTTFDWPIPTDPNQFYQDVGLIPHPRLRNEDGTSKMVQKLTAYQYKIWMDGFKYRYRLTVKSQKVGESTSGLMEDFQRCILPSTNPLSCRGYEVLIIGQTYEKAKDHLRDLRQWILASKKYKDFLITKPEDSTQNEESIKSMLYIRNPDDPNTPTRIIGLGMQSEAAIWSWKRVKFIHMSDVASSDMLDDSGVFAAAFSRLANTGGGIHIESPPRGQRGKVWDIYQKSQLATTDERITESQFKVNTISAHEAVEAGLITQEFLDQEKERLGIAYAQYYDCSFLNSSNSYYTNDLFSFDDDQEMG